MVICDLLLGLNQPVRAQYKAVYIPQILSDVGEPGEISTNSEEHLYDGKQENGIMGMCKIKIQDN